VDRNVVYEDGYTNCPLSHGQMVNRVFHFAFLT
jgi:hypothetical protein